VGWHHGQPMVEGGAASRVLMVEAGAALQAADNSGPRAAHWGERQGYGWGGITGGWVRAGDRGRDVGGDDVGEVAAAPNKARNEGARRERGGECAALFHLVHR
jgi:hypothetical protein